MSVVGILEYIGKDAHNRKAWEDDKEGLPKGVPHEYRDILTLTFGGQPPSSINLHGFEMLKWHG